MKERRGAPENFSSPCTKKKGGREGEGVSKLKDDRPLSTREKEKKRKGKGKKNINKPLSLPREK